MQVKFEQLWVGDRFRACDSLWTCIGGGRARKHSDSSIKLGTRGFGYIGDTVCSFEANDLVEFVPVEA